MYLKDQGTSNSAWNNIIACERYASIQDHYEVLKDLQIKGHIPCIPFQDWPAPGFERSFLADSANNERRKTLLFVINLLDHASRPPPIFVNNVANFCKI